MKKVYWACFSGSKTCIYVPKLKAIYYFFLMHIEITRQGKFHVQCMYTSASSLCKIEPYVYCWFSVPQMGNYPKIFSEKENWIFNHQMWAHKPGNWCWFGLTLGYVLFYCEHKPCYFCFNLQFCFHGNYGTGERAKRLFLHRKKKKKETQCLCKVGRLCFKR